MRIRASWLHSMIDDWIPFHSLTLRCLGLFCCLILSSMLVVSYLWCRTDYYCGARAGREFLCTTKPRIALNRAMMRLSKEKSAEGRRRYRNPNDQ